MITVHIGDLAYDQVAGAYGIVTATVRTASGLTLAVLEIPHTPTHNMSGPTVGWTVGQRHLVRISA